MARIGITGKVSAPINWMKGDKEVEFTLVTEDATVQVWLSNSLADGIGIRENVRLTVYGHMEGSVLRGESAIFYQLRHKLNDYHQKKILNKQYKSTGK